MNEESVSRRRDEKEGVKKGKTKNLIGQKNEMWVAQRSERERGSWKSRGDPLANNAHMKKK